MREIILISQSAIALGALSVWIACALPDCLEAFDACCDLYNLYPCTRDSSTTIARPKTPAPTRAVVCAAVLVSSLRIFGPYLSLLAGVLFLLCYFSASPASVADSVPRARRLRSFFSNSFVRPKFKPFKFKFARPRFTRMLLSPSSRKQLLLSGREPFRPLYGASSRASLAFADRTSALIRSVKSHGNGFKRGIRKAAYYSTAARPDNQTGGAAGGVGAGGPEWGPGLPLYRKCHRLWDGTIIDSDAFLQQAESSLRGRRRRRNGIRSLWRLGHCCWLRSSTGKK